MAACDPTDLVRQKVPEPIQDLLQFTPAPKPTRTAAAAVPQIPKLEISQPAADSTLMAGKEVLFQAAITMPPGDTGPPPPPDWTLFKDKENRPIPLGKTPLVRKPLEAGSYKVEVSLNYQNQRVAQTRNFRVIYAVVGTVLTRDGRPVPETEMVLTDLAGKEVLARGKSLPNGKFTVEIPPEGHFLLKPRKKGVGFNPYMKVVSYNKDLTPMPFTGTKSSIGDVRLTASLDSKQPLASLCPLQDGYITYTIQGEMKPIRVEAFLVHVVDDELRRIEFDQEEKPAATENPSSPETSQWLKVKVPEDLKIGAKPVAFRVAVAARDQVDDVVTAEASEEVTVDQSSCFKARLAEAIALQEKGELPRAVAVYDSIDRVFRKLEDPAPLAAVAEKAQFNRGLAHLALAEATTSQDPKYREALGKALSEFSGVLKTRPKDPQALLMRGVVKMLLQNYDSAREDLTSALAIDPQMNVAVELRARGLLATKLRKNLSPALEDLTEAITLDPSNQELRKMRRETLRLIVATENETPSATVDISKIPLGEIAKMVNTASYIRK
jgi:tetratricopeptide (TPR) repeat protein